MAALVSPDYPVDTTIQKSLLTTEELIDVHTTCMKRGQLRDSKKRQVKYYITRQ